MFDYAPQSHHTGLTIAQRRRPGVTVPLPFAVLCRLCAVDDELAGGLA